MSRRVAWPRSRDRECNGGPNGRRWCGTLATVVCTDRDGLQWYACDNEEHREGAETMPIDEWWRLVEAS